MGLRKQITTIQLLTSADNSYEQNHNRPKKHWL